MVKPEILELGVPNKESELFYCLIGKDVEKIYAMFGQPTRKEPSAYGYTWLVYQRDAGQYFQAGHINGEIVTIYALRSNNHLAPFDNEQFIDMLFSNLYSVLSWENEDSSYQIYLSEEDRKTRPLFKLGDVFVQLYRDKIDGSLSSVRFMDEETLIKHQTYHMFFQGDLIEVDDPSESEWIEIEEGIQRQIFDLTNNMRAKHDQEGLNWDETLASVALDHSTDMKKSGYFSHDSQKNGSLPQRLNRVGLQYRLGGENIAAYYMDAPDVVEAWLNSKGHRETLLNEEYTHLGVGVYREYFTQIFAQISEK